MQNQNQPQQAGQNPNQGPPQVQSNYAIFYQYMDWAANWLLRSTVTMTHFVISILDVLLLCKSFALIAVCMACIGVVGLVGFRSLKTVASFTMSVYNAKETRLNPIWDCLSGLLNDYLDHDQPIILNLDHESLLELYE